MDILLKEGKQEGKYYVLKNYHENHVKELRELKGRYYKKKNEWKFPVSVIETVRDDNHIIEAQCSHHTEKLTKIFSENVVMYSDKSTQTGELKYEYEPPFSFREKFQEYINLMDM